MAVNFHQEEIYPPRIPRNKLKSVLKDICVSANKQLGEINVIFCSDNYLLSINQEYLNHDYYTDIITFNYNEDELVNGDLFISSERIKDNAKEYKEPLKKELSRVVIHGVLHLIGLNDHSPSEKTIMRQNEDKWLKKLFD